MVGPCLSMVCPPELAVYHRAATSEDRRQGKRPHRRSRQSFCAQFTFHISPQSSSGSQKALEPLRSKRTGKEGKYWGKIERQQRLRQQAEQWLTQAVEYVSDEDEDYFSADDWPAEPGSEAPGKGPHSRSCLSTPMLGAAARKTHQQQVKGPKGWDISRPSYRHNDPKAVAERPVSDWRAGSLWGTRTFPPSRASTPSQITKLQAQIDRCTGTATITRFPRPRTSPSAPCSNKRTVTIVLVDAKPTAHHWGAHKIKKAPPRLTSPLPASVLNRLDRIHPTTSPSGVLLHRTPSGGPWGI